MIAIGDIVWAVVYMLIGGLVLGLLWWLISYIERQGVGPPVVFKVIRVIFVILVVLLLISILLGLLGFPIVRLR